MLNHLAPSDKVSAVCELSEGQYNWNLSTESFPTQQHPVILSRKEHSISRRDIDPSALKVLYRLHNGGFLGFLVGGGVRDLLLGRAPKDFDVVTDAQPSQIKRLFRNSFLVGRRFRLAHVRFGDTIIEVSTFRRSVTEEQAAEDIEEPIQQDNTYGTPEEDALRRDFTINAIFYNIADFSVIDYVGGLEDLKQRILRTIGEPNKRFREDPVRMIRAVRVAGRLNFDIDGQTIDAIHANRERVLDCPSSRVLEEVLTLFRYGSAERSIDLLQETKLIDLLLPKIDKFVQDYPSFNPAYVSPLHRYLAALDRDDITPLENRSVVLIISTLFYPLVMQAFYEARERGEVWTPDVMQELIHEFATMFSNRWIFPRRKMDWVAQVIMAQRRFFEPQSRRWRPSMLLEKPFFPEALDLFRILVAAEDRDPATLRLWEHRARSVLGPRSRKSANAAWREEPAAPGRRRPFRRRPPRWRGPEPLTDGMPPEQSRVSCTGAKLKRCERIGRMEFMEQMRPHAQASLTLRRLLAAGFYSPFQAAVSSRLRSLLSWPEA